MHPREIRNKHLQGQTAAELPYTRNYTTVHTVRGKILLYACARGADRLAAVRRSHRLNALRRRLQVDCGTYVGCEMSARPVVDAVTATSSCLPERQDL